MIHPMKEFPEQYTKEYNMDMSYPNPSFAALVCKKKLEFALQSSRRKRQSLQSVSYWNVLRKMALVYDRNHYFGFGCTKTD